MIVKFAQVCDLCGQRGEEYGPMVTCRACLRDVNRCCAAEWKEDEGQVTATCRECAK